MGIRHFSAIDDQAAFRTCSWSMNYNNGWLTQGLEMKIILTLSNEQVASAFRLPFYYRKTLGPWLRWA